MEPTPLKGTEEKRWSTLAKANAVAKLNKLFIVPSGDGYIVYRQVGAGNIRLGRRADPAALLRFVCYLGSETK